MSILGSIMSKIFHTETAHAETASASTAPAAAPDAPHQAAPSPSPSPAAAAAAATSAAAAATLAPHVDVAAVLDGLTGKAGETLDWRHSIVDLLKLLDLDSSLPARRHLAEELHYTGSTSDTAAMNTWLHKEVMEKLAASGGKVPDDLRA